MIGKILAEKYRIEEVIGKGGMGKVYRVWDMKLEKSWAMKEIADGSQDERQKKSLLAECQVLRQARHEFFPGIVDLLEEDGCCYLVMDLIEGETLKERIAREGMMEPIRAVKMMEQLADALLCLHRMQPPMYYLDLKPSNIMVEKQGRLRLIDFGSVVSAEGKSAAPVSASPGYAPPEQRRENRAEREVDERSDIYSLGKTAYAMLTGLEPSKPPYGKVGIRERNGAVSRQLEQIVLRCMEEEREKRYQTVESVKQALEKYRQSEKKGRWKQRLGRMAGWILLLAIVWQSAVFLECCWMEKEWGGNPAALLVQTALVLLLFRTGKKRERLLHFEQEKSVLRTASKTAWKGLTAFLLLMLAAAVTEMPSVKAFPSDAVSKKAAQESFTAQEDSREAEEILSGSLTETETKPAVIVRLRDASLRKLLVRDGAAVETNEPLYLELLPGEASEGEAMEVIVTARSLTGGKTVRYRFLYKGVMV